MKIEILKEEAKFIDILLKREIDSLPQYELPYGEQLKHHIILDNIRKKINAYKEGDK